MSTEEQSPASLYMYIVKAWQNMILKWKSGDILMDLFINVNRGAASL